MEQERDLQTFGQSASVGEGDGFAELPGHARHWGVKAQALLDAHGAVSHLGQVLPVGTGSLSPTLPPLPVLCWEVPSPTAIQPLSRSPCYRTEGLTMPSHRLLGMLGHL